MHTSGSTGTPFAVLQNLEKRRRVLAEVIYFGRMAGYRVGDRFLFTRVWTRNNRKSRLEALCENEIMFDISYLDDARMEVLRDILRSDAGIKCMIGYPSTFGPLIKYLEQRGDPADSFHLKTIISISERLPPQIRAALRSRFGCKVVSRYSNQENGVLAQQCEDQEEYHLNTASYVFEFLKLEEDLPAAVGERARLVVTDLFNRAMPMIRYDTGDVVVHQSSAACEWSPETLSGIEGRMDDFIYDTKDRLLSSAVVDLHYWPFTLLKQYQFIQEARGRYQIVLNGAREHYKDAEFIDLAKNFLGFDATVSVVHVDQIPLTASGKFKSVLNHYKPSA
jgi:phenylacetate-CoA ligase